MTDKNKGGSGKPNQGNDKSRGQGDGRGRVIRPGDNVDANTGTTSTGPRGPQNGKK